MILRLMKITQNLISNQNRKSLHMILNHDLKSFDFKSYQTLISILSVISAHCVYFSAHSVYTDANSHQISCMRAVKKRFDMYAGCNVGAGP